MAGAAEPAGALVLVPLSAGVLVAGALAGGASTDAWLAAVAVAVALASTAIVAAPRTRVALLALLVGGAVGLGRALPAAAPLARDHIARQAGRVPVAVEGTVVASDRAGVSLRLVLRAERARSIRGAGRVRGRVRVTIAHPTRPWPAGLRVRLVARLRRSRSVPGRRAGSRRVSARRGRGCGTRSVPPSTPPLRSRRVASCARS
jgi:hypothetical protein